MTTSRAGAGCIPHIRQDEHLAGVVQLAEPAGVGLQINGHGFLLARNLVSLLRDPTDPGKCGLYQVPMGEHVWLHSRRRERGTTQER